MEIKTSGGQLEQVFDPQGERIAYYSVASGNNQWLYAYVPWRGRGLARYGLTTEFDFFHANALGSATMATNPTTGAVIEDILFYPWGQEFNAPTLYDAHFAGLPASTLPSFADLSMREAPYRFYAPSPGRWHSPDPLGGDVTNPQSLNRYAYVMNNPTSFIDPLGLLAALGTDPAGYPGVLNCPDDMDACFTIWLPIGGWGGESGGGGGGGGGGTLPSAMSLTNVSDLIFWPFYDVCDPAAGLRRIGYQLRDKSGNVINEGWYSYEVTNDLGRGIAQNGPFPGTTVTNPANQGEGLQDPKSGVPISDGFNDHLGSYLWHNVTVRQQLGVSQTAPNANGVPNGQLIPIAGPNGTPRGENSIFLPSSGNIFGILVNRIGCPALLGGLLSPPGSR